MKSFLTVVLATVALGLWLEREPATLAQPVVAPAKPPGPLRTPYTSEHQWAVQEIAADIQEMAGKRVAAGDTELAGLTPWNPTPQLVAFASSQLGDRPAAAEDLPRDQHPGLLDASVPGLFTASEDVSKALKRNARNPRAHESAAMVLGAFGLLEAADDLSDHRWVMNRMTAHLAVAAALRGAGATSTDGRLAAATLATLANRQSEALDMIARFGDAKLATPIAAWQRVLLLRINQDWRVLSAPAKATRLEKLAYLRARRATLPQRRAGLELEELHEEDAADFARIVQSFSTSVEDGQQFVAEGVVRELVELGQLHQREFNRPMPVPLPDVVNDRAGRLMKGGEPRVIPWAAWAEFSQRHIAMAIADTDHHYRRTLALPNRADELNDDMDDVFLKLRMFSVASTSRRVGTAATEADVTYLREALEVLASSPELIPISYWTFFETAAAHEQLTGRVPPSRSWFVAPSAEVPYDAGYRLRDRVTVIPVRAHEALVEAAPSDVWVLATARTRRPSSPTLVARANTLVRERAGYDLWAIDIAANATETREEWEKYLRRGCELSPNRCLNLARRLSETDEQAAAAEFERALANPALDRVLAANNSEWLVFYYERNNEPGRARALAESAAKAHSHTGIRTLARLLERRGEVEAAAQLFETVAKRYPTSATSTLLGFLYRRAIVQRDARFARRWEEVKSGTFPNGLVPEATSADRPAAGVHVTADSPASRRVRLQAGDIIIGVDGWRVDNLDQFNAVWAFGDQLKTHRITAWRGALFTVSVPASHGMELDTHPLRGWIR